MSSTSMRLVRRNISIYIFIFNVQQDERNRRRKEEKNSKCVIERKAKVEIETIE